jgi:signal transduction histidine kinase/ligand-binding sensor domain-containing protein
VKELRSNTTGRCAAALLALVLMQEAGAERRFAEIGVGRGLGGRIVPALLVDRDGLLWVGSREGLYRYDGYEATTFLPDPNDPASISDLDIRALYQSDDGALWVSTNTNGVSRRDPRTGAFIQFRHDSTDPRSLSNASAFGITQDADGQIWIGTQHGLNRLDPRGDGFARYFHEPGNAGSLAANWVFALHRGPTGQLWIGTVGGGINRWSPATGEFETFSLAGLADGRPGFNDVFAIQEVSGGRIWAGTRGGLVVLDPASRVAERFDLIDDGDVQPLVTAMHMDGRGRLWVATLEHGLFGVEPATGRVHRVPPDELVVDGTRPTMAPLSIATTDHFLLVGMWGSGVLRAPLEQPAFRRLPRKDGLGGLRYSAVTAILSHPPVGQPWLGIFGGGPQRVDIKAGAILPSQAPPADPNLKIGVLSLAVTPDGSHFAGATDGLYRFAEDGSVIAFEAQAPDRPDGIGAGYVAALLPAGESDLWVGVGGSGLFLREAGSGRYRAYRHDPDVADSLSGDYITALQPGSGGFLWVGTRSNGLNHCRIQPWSCERFDGRTSAPRNLANQNVTALRSDGSGGMWVTTDGGGLFRAHVDASGRLSRFERWGADNGLLSDSIMSVETDDDGSLWLSTPLGLSRFDPATGRVESHVLQSGLPVNNFNRGSSAADSEFIYFGAIQGLVSIPRGTALSRRAPAPVQVTGAQRLSDGVWQPLSPGSLAGAFEAGIDDVLSFEFAVLDLSEASHEYAYRLDPQDAWTPLGPRRQMTFVGLAPGPYRFEVRGRDVFGQWSTSPVLEIEVIPPFWMTNWFRGLTLAGIATLLLGLHFGRLHSLRRRNAELKQLQVQREQALERAESSQRGLAEAYAGLRQLTARLASAEESERMRISRELHDEFGQTLTAAKINLQMLRRESTDAAVAQRLEDSVNMVERLIRQARDIARGLRPSLLDDLGLVPALEQHVEALAIRSNVRIELDAGGGVVDLPPDLQTTVFRIVQEGINNALRHARATRIRVTLREDPDAFRLLIEDDGLGYDATAVSQRVKRGEHLGLLGMTERVQGAGGTIRFDARPGAGSRIEVRIPLAEAVIGGQAAESTSP